MNNTKIRKKDIYRRGWRKNSKQWMKKDRDG